MSSHDARIHARVDALLEKGAQVLATRSGKQHNEYVEGGAFQEWRTQSQSALGAIVGSEHPYTTEFTKLVSSNLLYKAEAGMGILRALKDDLANGYLTKVAALVSAEVFSDFLDMANHLLDSDYKDPCASLVGAVLENGLRRIAADHGVQIGPKDYLGALNSKCAAVGIYNRLTFKQIDLWTGIRNHADHGHFGDYTKDNVGEMLRGVRDFLAAHIG